MSRCISCQRLLSDEELLTFNPHTKEPEDMCRRCQRQSGIEEPAELGELQHTPEIDDNDMMVGIGDHYPEKTEVAVYDYDDNV